MDYAILKNPLTTQRECLVIGVLSEVKTPQWLKLETHQHEVFQRLSTKLTRSGDLVWQTDFGAYRLLIIHCGNSNEYDARQVSKHTRTIAEQLLQLSVSSATICLPQTESMDPNRQIETMIAQFETTCYQLLDFKTLDKKAHALHSIDFFLEKATNAGIDSAKAKAAGVQLTRDLANLPANVCTPSYLATQAKQLTKDDKRFNLKVLERTDMEKLGMGALLAVAQGSHEPPKLIELQYHGGNPQQAPIVLIGKGVTFDTGGISLKPADGMQEMKFDMAGAASILGTLKAIALMNLKINILGLIAATENMPGGGAVKPGDIVTSLSGQTIEIINTDAEGRLILADALTYAEQFNPEWVIDVATLTGAAKIALGTVNSAFMSNDEELVSMIHNASQISQDKAWRLPLDEEYQDVLNSMFADFVNATFDRWGGSITGACFLSRFSKKFRWAHFDIAGSAWTSGAKACATGRPVPLLIELIRHAANTR